jgi:hypothetical protein
VKNSFFKLKVSAQKRLKIAEKKQNFSRIVAEPLRIFSKYASNGFVFIRLFALLVFK